MLKLYAQSVAEQDCDPLFVQVQHKNGQQVADHCHVTNLPPMTTDQHIQKLSRQYGRVKWCRLMRSPPSRAPTALVQMGNPEECQAAVAALNGIVLPDLEAPISACLKESEKTTQSEVSARVIVHNDIYIYIYIDSLPQLVWRLELRGN